MAKIKDTDYLVVSAQVRAMENTLLTAERMEQMLAARTDEEAVKLLQECGYPELDPADPAAMDAALYETRERMLEDVAAGTPDLRFLDSFKLKYDYHNAKAVLKALAVGADPASMLTDLGRVRAQELRRAVEGGALEDLPELLAEAVAQAKEVLDTTRDPQLCEVVLDRWMYRDLLHEAQESGSAFLQGYVRLLIDAANLRVLVRTFRMGKTADFLKNVLFEGGSVDAEALVSVAGNNGGGLTELYAGSALQAAAEAGAEALRGGALTEFEKCCDDAAAEYMAAARMVPFGEAPLLGYLAARETEFTNLRILLLGKAAGLPADVIRARLRAAYV